MNLEVLSVIAGLVFSMCIMAATWNLARRIENYSIVDAVWGYLFLPVAGIYALILPGASERKLLMLACAGLWSLRLGSYLAIRIRRHHPKEDSRYVTLRAGYAPAVARGFFRFFQYQAVSVSLLSIPFLMIARNETPGIDSREWIAAGLFLFSFLMEALSDLQKDRFNQDPKNRGKNCDVGLWRYSRHPNYFFEIFIWLSFALLAIPSPGGWISLFCPALILFLLLKVTGVPLSEAQSLKSRGEAFREYQQRTSVLIPWFPKQDKER
jgi:steroid 5-alpha reductase family enzyme